MDTTTFDSYQAEIEYRSNRIRKDWRRQPRPPRPSSSAGRTARQRRPGSR